MEVSDTLAEFWNTLKEYIPNKDKQPAAHHVVAHMIDFGLDEKDFYALAEVDTNMAEAIKEAFEEFDEYDSFDDY